MNFYSIKILGVLPSYNVGINQIEIDPDKVQINDLLELLEAIQNTYENTMLQFFNNRYVLNTEHILQACYFVQKAFHSNTNISNRKNLEFFLYLAAKRQIKISLEFLGIKDSTLQSRRLSYCVITSEDNFNQIRNEINN
ncbi:MAG: KEOPS complex subunit Cgi121 [Candidatus Hermodarchaeota archaeon]